MCGFISIRIRRFYIPRYFVGFEPQIGNHAVEFARQGVSTCIAPFFLTDYFRLVITLKIGPVMSESV